MRVRVCYTVEVTDEYRRAIRRYYGQVGMATRKEVADFCRLNGGTLDNDLMHECSDGARKSSRNDL